jgi:hypothetical protein
MIDLKETFDKFNDEYLRFERVEGKLNQRPDVCAFILLDRLLPREGRDMVASAEHDEIFLSPNGKELAAVATEEDILTLVRCGVRYSAQYDSLCMFV